MTRTPHIASRSWWLAAVLAAACLLACSVPDFRSDGGPDRRVDVSRIPNAEPRSEPLSRSGNPTSYVVFGKRYYTLQSARGYRERGIASWYGTKFHGRRTSNGEIYDMYAMTAAHKSLPLPTYVRVTNLRNGRWVVVRVNDRGPFHANRIIDLSYAAAAKLGIHAQGTGLVEVEAVFPDSRPAPVIATPAFDTDTSTPAAVPALFIQVGAFQNADNAQRLKTRLHSLFSEGIRIMAVKQGEALVHRVRVGPVTDVETADRIVQRLAAVGLPDAHIVVD